MVWPTLGSRTAKEQEQEQAAAILNCSKILLHPFNGLFSRTTWVNRYQKGKTNEATDDGLLGW